MDIFLKKMDYFMVFEYYKRLFFKQFVYHFPL